MRFLTTPDILEESIHQPVELKKISSNPILQQKQTKLLHQLDKYERKIKDQNHKINGLTKRHIKEKQRKISMLGPKLITKQRGFGVHDK